MYWQLLNYEDKENRFAIDAIVKTLRIGVCGASSLPVEIIRRIEAKYKIPIVEGYGLSETCPVATFNHLHKKRKPGSVGTPVWGVEVKIVNSEKNEVGIDEVGEIVIRGYNVMRGYYNKPDATLAAFKGTSWFHTGDLGKKDTDGYVYIVDRVKDMMPSEFLWLFPKKSFTFARSPEKVTPIFILMTTGAGHKARAWPDTVHSGLVSLHKESALK
jgi:long-chain acyl-CoA synthetase